MRLAGRVGAILKLDVRYMWRVFEYSGQLCVRDSIGMKCQADHVRYWKQRGTTFRNSSSDQREYGSVGVNDVTTSVHDHRRVRRMSVENCSQNRTNIVHLGRIQFGLGVSRSELGRVKQSIAVPQRQVESDRQVNDHLPARLGPPGF